MSSPSTEDALIIIDYRGLPTQPTQEQIDADKEYMAHKYGIDPSEVGVIISG